MAVAYNPYTDPNNPLSAQAGQQTLGSIVQPSGAFDWNQYQTQDARTFDPSQAIDNTGVAGGTTRTLDPYNPYPAPGTGSVFGGGVSSGASGQVQPSGIMSSGAQINWERQQQGLPPLTYEQMQGGAATPGTMPSGGMQQWDQNSFAQQFGRPGTPQELVALEPQLQQAGIKVIRNAQGVAGKIQLPNGQIVDIINAAGAGGQGFQWLTGEGGGGGQGGTLADLGYARGAWQAPWTEQFSAPTAEQALNSPGFQFAMQEGLKGIQNSAAAKGTLLSGGTLKALNNYAQGTALQNYGDLYNRNMGEYLLRRENFQQNQDRPFNKNITLAELGKPS